MTYMVGCKADSSERVGHFIFSGAVNGGRMSSEPMTLQRVEDMVSHKSYDHQYSEEELKDCEERLVAYAKKLASEGNIGGLRKLLVVTRPFYDVLGRAKASKLIRVLMEYCLQVNQDNKEKVLDVFHTSLHASATAMLRW
ncbi:unnamed protein product [Heligmosomoides polygyrus]|uniref:RPN6_N domain-containing protein n=1 Tax=Heligmosomoides polygyrus TaxID=6339 RepID=A0A183G753_HELPZ|nr:unnamed protein product [Heligmosomoides polygyrus]